MKKIYFKKMFETLGEDAPISEEERNRSKSEARRAYQNAKKYSHEISSKIRTETTHRVFEPKDKEEFEKSLEFTL